MTQLYLPDKTLICLCHFLTFICCIWQCNNVLIYCFLCALLVFGEFECKLCMNLWFCVLCLCAFVSASKIFFAVEHHHSCTYDLSIHTMISPLVTCICLSVRWLFWAFKFPVILMKDVGNGIPITNRLWKIWKGMKSEECNDKSVVLTTVCYPAFTLISF